MGVCRYNVMMEPELRKWAEEFGQTIDRSGSWVINRAVRNAKEQAEAKSKTGANPKRSKPVAALPSNFDEQFELLWAAKGKKGAKKKAMEIYQKMSRGADDEKCAAVTAYLIEDIECSQGETGFAELHLTTYLNQERWQK